jgi:hypothetical protein
MEYEETPKKPRKTWQSPQKGDCTLIEVKEEGKGSWQPYNVNKYGQTLATHLVVIKDIGIK